MMYKVHFLEGEKRHPKKESITGRSLAYKYKCGLCPNRDSQVRIERLKLMHGIPTNLPAIGLTFVFVS